MAKRLPISIVCLCAWLAACGDAEVGDGQGQQGEGNSETLHWDEAVDVNEGAEDAVNATQADIGAQEGDVAATENPADTADTEPMGRDAQGAQDILDEGETLLTDVESTELNLDSSSSSQGDADAATALTDAAVMDAAVSDDAQETPLLPDVINSVEDADPPDEQGEASLWLLSVDNATETLQKVDVETGTTTDVCTLPPGSNYPSLTFSRLNGLYGSNFGSSLDLIDPCTCEVTAIGTYGLFSGIYGITADPSDNLYGVATTEDHLVSISTEMGAAISIGPLGTDFWTSGATWADEEQVLYAINGNDHTLYDIDRETGFATAIAVLSQTFSTVGIELHPQNGILYACSGAADLLRVDTESGEVVTVGHMNQLGDCTNLAAPWFDVPCIDDL